MADGNVSGEWWAGIVAGSAGIGVAATKFFEWIKGWRESGGNAHKAHAEAEATLQRLVDERLQVLIKGYQDQIEGLTKEVHAAREQAAAASDHATEERRAARGEILELREEVKSLRIALDEKRLAEIANAKAGFFPSGFGQ